ncbi:MAG: SUMF1/EgtB/PvdO family nonheme iron enzyme, partial [Nannocystaceae bacterium]
MLASRSAQAIHRALPWILAAACLGVAPPADEPLELTDVHGDPFPTRAQEAAPLRPAEACPRGMIYVNEGTYEATPLPGFCLDAYEVTVADFAAYLQALGEAHPDAPARSKRAIKALRRSLSTTAHERDESEEPGESIASGDSATSGSAPRRCTWTSQGAPTRHPINCISVVEAQAYCRYYDKRLPTRREWRWAARGGERAYPYPWGRGKPSGHVQRAAAPDDPHARPQGVGQFPPSLFGAYDLG